MSRSRKKQKPNKNLQGDGCFSCDPAQMEEARRRVLTHEARVELTETLEDLKERNICRLCGSPADWLYMPGDSNMRYCDLCVPRGCSCWIEESGEEIKGDDGRQLPCIEYWEI